MEVENDYFEVQRSKNGYTWEPVGIVQGAGNSAEPHSCLFTDNNPGSGEQLYRLMQVDWDGEVHFSPVNRVSCLPFGKSYPIWVSGRFNSSEILQTSFSWPLETEAVFNLLDLSGKVIDSWKGNVQAGENSMVLETELLSSGMYLLEINDGRFLLSRQIPLVD